MSSKCHLNLFDTFDSKMFPSHLRFICFCVILLLLVEIRVSFAFNETANMCPKCIYTFSISSWFGFEIECLCKNNFISVHIMTWAFHSVVVPFSC